eukprot:sb/3462661/
MSGSDPYILTSPSLPSNPNNNPILSNSFLGHRLHGNTVHINGLYNGHTTTCHRARVPCPFPYVSSSASITGYTLNCKEGTYTITGRNFTQRSYAHSVLNRVFVTEITVNGGDVGLESHHGPDSADLTTTFMEMEGEVVKFSAQITAPETATAPHLTVAYVSSAFPVTLTAGSYLYLAAFGEDLEEAVTFYNLALGYAREGELFSTHTESWKWVWDTVSIDANGNDDLNQTIKSSLYYLLASFPHFALEIPGLDNYPFTFFGVSPGSLGNGGDNQDYWGHVFWDQDLWMLPGVLSLFPSLVRQSILYRIAMLPGARTKARAAGYMGAMYPWESGRTGVDVCPGKILYADNQQHITACVVYAMRQYCYGTGGWGLLTEDGAWDVVRETADFWASRVQWREEGVFVIDNVMDPDEYHARVNNSAFTNSAARLNLEFAIEAADKLDKTPDPRWVSVVDKIKIPFDEQLRYHPEFDGYTQGTLIKQASVVLMGYPLGVTMPDDVRRNDITVYEKCTDKGPGMTYSMYSVGMLELGDETTAGQLFQIQFKNLRAPFKVWNEYPEYVGCTNFLTAVGGFLQSLIHGYLGVRVEESVMYLSPHLLPGCTSTSYTGIVYHGERYNVTVKQGSFTITRTTGNGFEVWSIVDCGEGGKSYPLITGKPVDLPAGKYKICQGDERWEMVDATPSLAFVNE